MFNCHSGEPHRDTDTPRNKYNNIKKRAKAKFSEEKKYMYGTGGGSAKKQTDDNIIMNDIQEIAGAQITGMESKYDDNSFACENPKITVVKCVPANIVSETVSELDSVEFVFESSKQNDWSNYNPDILKTPIAKELQTATCETREKHQQYIDLQEKESEQRLRLQKEKHDLEMKILCQQNSNVV
ncbi:hypothetical protein FQA39_LY08616 [Lamprigera yunnana]|nr:hypothetical protein FQA39_LY08616 [Lamprigera yunnana]